MEAEESHASKRSRGGGGPGPWNHPASRIYRVSRASGGKDRHSKVYTAKGLRDRRVRLSVSTAIQFYDLQDRLGFDQPSKAIEWLIKAADAAISELPTLESSYPLPPKEENPEVEAEPDNGQLHQLTKSGGSSTSETSKGSVLSLSRSESRVKARERARERAAKENEHTPVCSSLNSQSSFTELLTGVDAAAVTVAQMNSSGANCGQKQTRYLPVSTAAAANYFAQASSSQSQLVPFNIAAAGEHSEMQQYSFLQDHPVPLAAVAASGEYNLNFSISPGLAALNRGTLQSNSPSQLSHHQHHHQHLQRLSSPADGANMPMPFYFGTSAPTAGVADNQFPAGFDGRLQLFYGDGYRHSDMKGKGKS